MEGSSPVPGTSISVTRRRLQILACLLLIFVALSSVGIGGYFAYQKNQNTNSDSTSLTSTTAMLPTNALVQMLETSTSRHVSTAKQSTIPRSSEVATISDTHPSLTNSKDPQKHTELTTSPTYTAQSTLSSINISTKNTTTTDHNMSSSSIRATSVTFTEQTTSSTLAISTERTSTDVIEISTLQEASTIMLPGQTITDIMTSLTTLSTLASTKRTTEYDNSATSVPISCSTNSFAALGLNFSGVNSDPCLESSDTCGNGSASESSSIPCYCECAEDGIWTIIQRRFDGSVDFYRNWTEYKYGFGDPSGEFWLGNDIIHQMTSNASYTLKIYLTGWDNITKYAVYETFRIADEADSYRLTIGGYYGDAGDSMTTGHNDRLFSTKDVDNDPIERLKLAEYYTGAWWYGTATSSSLNGKYYYEPNVPGGKGGYGITWGGYSGTTLYSLKETKMMIKEN